MCKLLKFNKKRHHSDLTDTGTLRNVDVPLVSSVLTLKRFHTFFQHVTVGWVYQQRPKYRQVKIAKHARTGANHIILTKRIKLQLEKKLVSNFKVCKMQALCKLLRNLLRFSFCKNNFFIGKKTVMETISCELLWPISNKYIYEV